MIDRHRALETTRPLYRRWSRTECDFCRLDTSSGSRSPGGQGDRSRKWRACGIHHGMAFETSRSPYSSGKLWLPSPNEGRQKDKKGRWRGCRNPVFSDQVVFCTIPPTMNDSPTTSPYNSNTSSKERERERERERANRFIVCDGYALVYVEIRRTIFSLCVSYDDH